MPMMATTIMSSIRVKPFSCFFMVSPPALGRRERHGALPTGCRAPEATSFSISCLDT
jgi:hypothetical protein